MCPRLRLHRTIPRDPPSLGRWRRRRRRRKRGNLAAAPDLTDRVIGGARGNPKCTMFMGFMYGFMYGFMEFQPSKYGWNECL